MWAHVPVLVNEQRKKLSKRRDKVALEQYRDEGYLADAMVNYLMTLGWSPGDTEIVPWSQIEPTFRLEDVNKSPAFFDLKKLAAFNGEYIRMLSRRRVRRGLRSVAAVPNGTASGSARSRRTSRTGWSRSPTPPPLVDFMFADDPVIDEAAWEKATATEFAAPLLRDLVAAYETCDWDAATLKAVMDDLAARYEVKLGKAQAARAGRGHRPLRRPAAVRGARGDGSRRVAATAPSRPRPIVMTDDDASSPPRRRERSRAGGRASSLRTAGRGRGGCWCAWPASLAVLFLVLRGDAVPGGARRPPDRPRSGRGDRRARGGPVRRAAVAAARRPARPRARAVGTTAWRRSSWSPAATSPATASPRRRRPPTTSSTAACRRRRSCARTQGHTTYESLDAAADQLLDAGLDEVVLVTDPYHSLRSRLIAEEVGLDADAVTDADQRRDRLVVVPPRARWRPGEWPSGGSSGSIGSAI